MIISRIYYTVTNKTSDSEIKSYSFSALEPAVILKRVTTSLSLMKVNSKYEQLNLFAAMPGGNFLSVDYSYNVVFTSEISTLQYHSLERKLKDVLQTYLGNILMLEVQYYHCVTPSTRFILGCR